MSGRLDLQLLEQGPSDLLREATKMILAAFWPRFYLRAGKFTRLDNGAEYGLFLAFSWRLETLASS